MRSVTSSEKFTSGSRISASRSDLLKVLITKIVVRNLQFEDCWANDQEHLTPLIDSTRGHVLSAETER